MLTLHQATGVAPTLPDLSSEVTRNGQGPVFGGEYCPLYLELRILM
jgi:hypothetical protein